MSRAYNDTSGITVFPANNHDLSGEWARADFDRLQRFDATVCKAPDTSTSTCAPEEQEDGRPVSRMVVYDAVTKH